MQTQQYLIVFLFSTGMISCKNEVKKSQEIQLTNTSEYELKYKPIVVKRSLLVANDSVAKYPVILVGKDTIPSQANDLDSDGKWDELFFLTDFKAGESKAVTLGWNDETIEYPKRTSARFGKRASADAKVRPALEETMMADELPLSLGYQQYQTDGPSWENDKVGFRHYLDGRNAKDLFGKKTSEISPKNVGVNSEGAVEDNYHTMEDWGRDILAVGNSVGLGGYALATEDALMRLGVTVEDSINTIEKTTFRIVAEGPVNSVLEYTFENWKPNDRTYTVDETTSIWLGMYGYQSTISLSGLQGDEHLVVGLVNINNDKPLEIDEENKEYVVLFTHDKQTYEKEWWLGMALILPKEHYLGYMEAPETGNLSNTYLAQMKIENNEPVQYYAVGAWELSDKNFIDKAYFKSYVTDLANQLSAKIDIKVNP